ncbi:META domain-containing protein [Knoellia aerolata]|nr:META domain-containing protein [Knoellia aerolata]
MSFTLRHRWVALAAVVAIVVLGGAYAVRLALHRAADEDAGWLDSLEPVQGQWVSSTGFARDGSSPWAAPVRVSVDGDELRFDVGCNRLTATATVDHHRLQSERGVMSTLIGCPPEVAAHEAWIAALVADHAQVQLKGSTEGMMFSLTSDAGWIGFLRD